MSNEDDEVFEEDEAIEGEAIDSDAPIDIDFGSGDEHPHGLLLLEIKQVKTPKKSKAGNRMIDTQLKVVGGDDGAYDGRIIFDTWMLEGGGLWRTKQAFKAFTGNDAKGPKSLIPSDLVGKQCWCLVEVEPSKDPQYEPRPRIKKYGARAPQTA